MITVNKLISFCLLLVIGLSLFSEMASAHRPCMSSDPIQLENSSAPSIVNPEAASSDNPAADCCDQGFCHISHCAHLALTRTVRVENVDPELSAHSRFYRFVAVTSTLEAIFRPPIC